MRRSFNLIWCFERDKRKKEKRQNEDENCIFRSREKKQRSCVIVCNSKLLDNELHQRRLLFNCRIKCFNLTTPSLIYSIWRLISNVAGERMKNSFRNDTRCHQMVKWNWHRRTYIVHRERLMTILMCFVDFSESFNPQQQQNCNRESP